VDRKSSMQIASVTSKGDSNALSASCVVESSSQEMAPFDVHELFRAKRLRAEYGPWLLKKNGRWFLNDGFWAAWLCARLGVYFDRGNDVFRSVLFPETQSNRALARAVVATYIEIIAPQEYVTRKGHG